MNEELIKLDLSSVYGYMLDDNVIKGNINFMQRHIDEVNKLVITEQKEKYIRELLNRIDKAIEWVYIVQQNENNKHLEPIISIDELDELLEILKGENND